MYRSNFPQDPGMSDRQYVRSRLRTPQTSLRDQLKANWLAVIVGVSLFCFASVLIVWNEGRAVQSRRSLDEGLSSVKPTSNIDVIFDENNKKLIHVTGKLKTDKELSEPDYGISVSAVRLIRQIQMYQWIEEENSRELGAGDQRSPDVTYSYYTDWRSNLVKSSLFNNPVMYQNPDKFPMEDYEVVAETVKVGSFVITHSLLESINNLKPITSHERPKNQNIKLHAGMYYHTADVWNPQVGDIRIEFSMAGLAGEHGEEVSVIAQQIGDELHPYTTAAGDKIALLVFGIKSPEEMFRSEQAQNVLITWGLRAAGLLLMFVAFSCVMSILNVLVSRFSVLRDLVNLGVMSLNASLAWIFSLILIAFGWILYRPFFGFTFLFFATFPLIISSIRLYLRDNAENQYRRA